MKNVDAKEQAIEFGCQAYSKLVDAGIPEEFIALMSSIAQANRGTFFGSFGSDTGCFIEFCHSPNSLTPVRLCFGIRRFRQPLVSRLWQGVREMWAIFRSHDSEHEIYLRADDITRLKDLLRVLR